MPYWAQPPYGNCDDSTEFQLLSIDPSDATNLPVLTQMPLKVLLSVGGWNFPSEYFSAMASSAESRGKFVNSTKAWMDKYGVAGIDLDWEYPCSPARSDPVKISCTGEEARSSSSSTCNCGELAHYSLTEPLLHFRVSHGC